MDNNKKNFNKMYHEFETKFNPYPCQMSRQSAFAEAWENGLIDEETYHEAAEYFGNLWCYTGD